MASARPTEAAGLKLPVFGHSWARPIRLGGAAYLPLPVAMPAMNCFWNTM